MAEEEDLFARLAEEMAESVDPILEEFDNQASTAETEEEDDAAFANCPTGRETTVTIMYPFRFTFKQGELALSAWMGARQGNVAAAVYLGNFVRAFLNDMAHHMAHAYEQVGMDATDHSSILNFLEAQEGLDEDDEGEAS